MWPRLFYCVLRLSWFPVKGNTRLGRGCRRPHATSPNPHLKKTKPHTSRGLTEPGPILNDRIDLPLIPYPDTRCWILLAGRRPYASGSTCTASHLHGLWWPAFSSRRWFRQQADGHELSTIARVVQRPVARSTCPNVSRDNWIQAPSQTLSFYIETSGHDNTFSFIGCNKVRPSNRR